MPKVLPLGAVADLTQVSTAQTTINTNTTNITSAFQNTLSLDGSTPNQMQANLDLNSNQIINLPAPSSINSPVRLADITPNTVGLSTLTGDVTGVGTGTIVTTVSKIHGTTVSGTTGTVNAVLSTSPTITTPTLTTASPTTAGTIGFNGSQIAWGDGSAAHAAVSTDQVQTLLNKTLTAPTITNATTTQTTVTTLTSGTSLTYTTPTNCKRIWVRAWGGGGGGAGSGTSGGGNGGTGGNTSFAGGAVTLTCNGGTGATYSNTGISQVVGTGGTATGGDDNLSGPNGSPGVFGTGSNTGGNGADAGRGYGAGGLNAAGASAPTNSGGGGGGSGGVSGTSTANSAGGAGGRCEKLIASPNATYTYTIGTAGTAGGAGTSGSAGGAGGAGFIIIHEYYI